VFSVIEKRLPFNTKKWTIVHFHPKTLFEIAMALLTISVSFPSKSRFSVKWTIVHFHPKTLWTIVHFHPKTLFEIAMDLLTISVSFPSKSRFSVDFAQIWGILESAKL